MGNYKSWNFTFDLFFTFCFLPDLKNEMHENNCKSILLDMQCMKSNLWQE